MKKVFVLRYKFDALEKRVTDLEVLVADNENSE